MTIASGPEHAIALDGAIVKVYRQAVLKAFRVNG